jgi:curved DNA-binding protein CbpA
MRSAWLFAFWQRPAANSYHPAVLNHYEILGLVRSADAGAIRKAHRTLARKYHPDLNPAADAAEKFARVQEAYETLIDPKSKTAYDLRLAQREAGYAGASAGSAATRGGTYAWSNIAAPSGSKSQTRGAGSSARAAAAGAAKAAAELREEELDEEAAEIWRVWFAGRSGQR